MIMISQLASEQPVRFKYTYIFDKCYHIAYLQNYNLRASSNLLFLSSSILDVFRRARSFSLRNGYVLALSRAIIIPHRQEYDVIAGYIPRPAKRSRPGYYILVKITNGFRKNLGYWVKKKKEKKGWMINERGSGRAAR